ncbi:hypothetical protein WMF11_05235 [Sorangium sp. So ce295]|uniref:hypothetical protein n=1 Tax=Sorangium sp. So ce295 TaxID=3133295 RepID=UPI003F635390
MSTPEAPGEGVRGAARGTDRCLSLIDELSPACAARRRELVDQASSVGPPRRPTDTLSGGRAAGIRALSGEGRPAQR